MRAVIFTLSAMIHLLFAVAANGQPAPSGTESLSVALSKIERKDDGRIWMSILVHNGSQTPIYVYRDIVDLRVNYQGKGDDWLKSNSILYVLPPDVLDFLIKQIDPGKTLLLTAQLPAKERGNLFIDQVSVSLQFTADRRDFLLERQTALRTAQPLIVRFSGDSWRVVPAEDVKKEKEKRKGKVKVTK